MNRGQLLTIIAGITGLYQVVIASRVLTVFGVYFSNVPHRAVSVVLVLIIVYLSFSLRGEKGEDARLAWYDAPLLLGGLIGAGFIAVFYDAALDYSTRASLDTFGIIMALLLGVALLEAVRRSQDWIMVLLVVVLISMTVFQNYLPGVLHGKGLSAGRLAYSIYIGSGGIFGLALRVATSIIVVFLVYARLLRQAGIGEWFLELATALTGRTRGGPAKASIVASAFFGMISGSPTANAATVGTFTIPLMIKAGYRPKVAGAIEACASSGGQIMPPVMGAVAFVMAEWINVPYGEVAKAAFIPATLYFVALLASAHFEALRSGLGTMPMDQIPSAMAVLKKGWFYLIPLGALIYFLVFAGYPADVAGMYSLPLLIGSSFLSRNREHWLTPKPLFLSLAAAAKTWAPIAAISASVGMLIGALELSGLAIRVPAFLLDASGGNLALTLLFVGLASLVLGTGLESIPCYMLLASLAAPTLITLGLSPIVAHFYVLYWGVASFITPPLAVPVYVACGLSGSRLWPTGWEAMKFGICAYVVPFAFAFNQALMLQGSPQMIAIATITATMGAVVVAAGLRGYLLWPMNIMQRLVAMVAGLLLIAPDVSVSLVGLGIVVAVILWQLRTRPVPVPQVGQSAATGE
ncbi:MAG: TRAP transporter fused permease subunit [Chloroflexi bacterium]|nr:TRAP transporter fused permease subunit [Chloroflexota bacterium]